MEDRKNEQKRQPDALRPEENRTNKPVELDLDQLDKVSGGTSSIPPEWFMKDEYGHTKKTAGADALAVLLFLSVIPRSYR